MRNICTFMYWQMSEFLNIWIYITVHVTYGVLPTLFSVNVNIHIVIQVWFLYTFAHYQVKIRIVSMIYTAIKVGNYINVNNA